MRISSPFAAPFVLVLALALGALLAAAAPEARAESFDGMVPKDTVLFVALENLPRTRERYRAGPLKALWDDPAVAAFTAKGREQWTAAMEESKQTLGMSVEEVLDLVTGEVAFALWDEGGDSHDATYVLLADIGENGEKIAEVMSNAERKMLEGDRYRRFEEEFRGVTIVTLRSVADLEAEKEAGAGPEEAPGEDEDGIGPLRAAPGGRARVAGARSRSERPSSWCMLGSTFAASANAETLKQVLAMREDDAVPGLADHEPYRHVRSKTGERTDLVAYVGCTALFDVMKAAGELPPRGEHLMAALGLAAIDAVGMQTSLSGDSLATNLFVSVPGKKEGVLVLFGSPNEGLRPPAIIAPEAVNAATWSVDLPGLWAEFRRIANRIEPGLLANTDAGLEFVKGATGVDLQTDIIGALGKEISWYVLPTRDAAGAGDAGGDAPGAPGGMEDEDGDGEAFEPPALVASIGVADRQKLEGALAALQMVSQGMMQEEEYLGVKMRLLTLPMPIPVRPAFALLPDRLVFAMRVEDLKDVLTRAGKDTKSLRDTAEFQRCLPHLPEGRIFVGFTREAQALRQSLTGALAGMVSGRIRGPGAPFDLSLFPSEEVLGRYLDVGATSMVNEEDGIAFRYVLVMKPQTEK